MEIADGIVAEYILAVLLPIIVMIIVGICCRSGENSRVGGETDWKNPTTETTGKEYEHKQVDVHTPDYHPLADQFDGRITNVFKNPWEDIL